MCDEKLKDGFIDDQDCENCKDRILPENQFAWELIIEMSPGLFDGFGGVRYEAIEHVFNRNEIPLFQRRELAPKVAVYIEAVREYQDREGK